LYAITSDYKSEMSFSTSSSVVAQLVTKRTVVSFSPRGPHNWNET